MAYGEKSFEFVENNISKLNHRGPDNAKIIKTEKLSIAFTRLSINDKTIQGNQPFKSNGYISVVNGEVYNHKELKSKYNISYLGSSDINIINPLFEKINKNIINELDGFYSGLIYEENTNKLFTIRDYIGKKPLFLVKSGNLNIITSELKVISKIDNFIEIPKGLCEIDIENFTLELLLNHKFKKNYLNNSLYLIINKAVDKRLPQINDKFGVFISGGLDSSIIASIVKKHRDEVIYYVLGSKNESNDYSYAVNLIKYLGLKNVKFIDLPSKNEIKTLISKIVYASESYNPSIISNGLCTYLLSKAAKEDGIKVVISGEGADELFCGYHYLKKEEDWKKIRSKLIEDMQFTELRRLDLLSMDNSIEMRCPFLDKEVYSYSENLNYSDFFVNKDNTLFNKYILRKTFEDDLPNEIIYRKKISFDVGSGIRKMIVNILRENGKSEKEELKSIWKRHFSKDYTNTYFHSYPTFDEVIEKRNEVHKI
ncbi:MAG: hypothetical protein HRT42_14250 [Campylobacteraceae bacterium]|nr:hypothetical protein [Campylobacteraceae bacterium]